MAVSLTTTLVDAAPGNTVTLSGSGLTGATATLQNQGLVTPANMAIPLTIVNDTTATFVVQDGVTSANLVVTAPDTSTATCFLNVVSQYCQASAYSNDAEGTDDYVSSLATGQLDEVLRDASSYIDDAVGTTLRLLQVQEDHRFSNSRRVWPHRGPRSKIPIISLDALSFITSNAIVTNFTVSGSAPDVYVNKTLGYLEVQTYAVGNAILLGQIQTIGFSANVWRVTYTAGYPWQQFPRDLRKATAIIATELLIYRGIIQRGLGGLMRIREGEVLYDRRQEPFAIPQPALDLLVPYRPIVLR